MREQDDKYTMEGDDMSQVRTIIKRLNEEAPSKEKSREVIVRADGTKVVRVTKKRRVMVTEREKRAHSRRIIVIIFLLLLLSGGAFGAFFAYRLSMMSGETYLMAQSEALKTAWGATNLSCSGARIDGMTLSVEQIVAEFPEGSMVEKLELSGISASLSAQSFVTGRITGDALNIQRTQLTLRAGDGTMHMPLQQGEDLWIFNRIVCKELDAELRTESGKLLELQGADAYLYYPRAHRKTSSVKMSGGQLMVKGWKMMELKDAKLLLSPTGVEDFSLRVCFAGAKADDGSYITISGQIDNGTSLAGPFSMVANRIPLAELTQGRFTQLLTAKTAAPVGAGSKLTVRLPLEAERPEFQGEIEVTDLAISGMPGLNVIRKHIEQDKRRYYLPVTVTRGKVSLALDGQGGSSLEINEGELLDAETVSLRGKIKVDAGNNLSGSLDYGIPEVLATREYADGRPDPVFQQHGSWCWLNTTLSGSANAPRDDAMEQDARAEGNRVGRQRLNLDQVDLDTLIRDMPEPEKAIPDKSSSSSNSQSAVPTASPEGWSSNPWQDELWDQNSGGKPQGESPTGAPDLPQNPFGE